MKKHLLYVSLILISALAEAQVTPRNFLAKAFSKEMVQKALIAQKDYKPYPKTRAEWVNIIPEDEQKQIIKRGIYKIQ